ncbi:ABC transporter substrate-binding protein [Nonomuraea sp. NPDC002799]
MSDFPRLRPALTGLTTVALLALSAACGGSADPAPATANKPAAGRTVAGLQIAADPALHAKLPESVRSSGKVRAGTDPTIPPWEMRDEDATTIIGMDVDLGQAIGAKLGVDFVFTAQQFDGLIPAMQAGKLDVAISNMADTAERQAVVDFVDYASDGASLMVPKAAAGTIKGLTDVCGKKVALTAGSTYEKFVRTEVKARCTAAGQPEATPLVFPNDAATQLAVKSGKAEATLTDGPSAAYIARTVDGGNAFAVVLDPAAPTGYHPVPIGIAMTKTKPELRDAVKEALQALITDGTYRRIMDKYGLADYGVKSATVNAGAAA